MQFQAAQSCFQIQLRAYLSHQNFLPLSQQNYFFEWLHWFAYPILGLAAGLYVLWIYPVLMWLFLYYITGIPFSEQQALRHRGQNYRDYQQRTSMFIPWQPKE